MSLRLAAVCLVVCAAPFEPRASLVTVGDLSVTATEAVWLIAAALWTSTWRTWPPVNVPLALPLVCWVAVSIAAAIAADAHATNALKASGRLVTLALTAWIVATSITRPADLRVVCVAALATGVVVAGLALAEVAATSAIDQWLEVFRESVRLVGGDVRASASLQYPTIAAAVLQQLLCLGTGLIVWIAVRRTRGGALAATGVGVVAVGLSLTLTRAAVLGAAAGLAVLLVIVARHRLPSRAVWSAAVGLVLTLVPPLVLSAGETMRLRWSSEGRAGWYRANFEAPAAITAAPGAVVDVPAAVTNTGRRSWRVDDRPPFFLAYHVVDADSTRVIRYEGTRTALPRSVAPGERVAVTMRVRAPSEHGRYRLAWDVVQEHRLWFGAEPGAEVTFTALVVEGEPDQRLPQELPATGAAPSHLVVGVEAPGRPRLWRAALALSADAPWLGVGPDNFRLRAGPYLAPLPADPRVHSNNLYLEQLTGAGWLGLASFVWLVVAACRTAGRRLRVMPPEAVPLYAGACAAGIALLTHGVFDAFLTFTPTLYLTGVIAGVVASPQGWRA